MATVLLPSEQRILDNHRQNLTLRQVAPETMQRYMNIATDYLVSQGGWSREDIIEFMENYRKDSTTYQRFIWYGVKALFESREATWPMNKRETPKISKPTQRFLTFEQAERFLEFAKTDSLEYALVRVDAVTGARRKELSDCLFSNYSRPTLRIGGAKGSEERVRTLDSETCDALDAYIKVREQKDSPYLFTSSSGKIGVTALSKIFTNVKKKMPELGKGYGWHAIRRGVVTWLFNAGMREKEIQEALGWKSPSMPSKYIQLTSSEVEERIQETHPLFKKDD